MKRELIGMLASLVLGAGVAAADSDDDLRPSTSPKKKDKPRSAAEVSRLTQQAMSQVEAARRALERDELETADDALERSERTLKKLHGGPRTQAMVDEIDTGLRRLDDDDDDDLRSTTSANLGPLMAMVKSNRAWIDPQVSARVSEADRRLAQGDEEGAADSLRVARSLLVSNTTHSPIEDAYMRVIAARQALDEQDPASARRILSGIPTPAAAAAAAVEPTPAAGTPLAPTRAKLEAAATAAEDGNWKQASVLLAQANREVRNLRRSTRDEPFAADLTSLGDELDMIEQQLANGAEPSPRKLRELARRARTISGEG